MARNLRHNRISRQEARTTRRQASADAEARQQMPRAPVIRLAPFQPKTRAQGVYKEAISSNVITFAVGPAGTGKSFVAAAAAAEWLKADVANKVIVTRPMLEAGGEKMGYQPGDAEEKYEPFIRPFAKLLEKRMGSGAVECMVKNGRLIYMPMGFMLGETFENTLVIADEMQNATQRQFRLLLTRIGDGSRYVVDGDPAQAEAEISSGLEDAIERLGADRDVAVVRFTRQDIVRHDIIQRVLEAYEN